MAEKSQLDTRDYFDWEEALVQCERIEDKCAEVPDRGEDFATSVFEKVQDISSWIEEHEEVTEAQKEALDNMESGIDRWIY